MSDYGQGIASREKINEGGVTDAYFERTEETLEEAGKNPFVKAQVSADQFKGDTNEILCGVKEAADLLSGLPIDVYALPEGSVFNGHPVMRIEGNYLDFARYETALLGLLSQSSAYATKAREVVDAADGTPVLSFGSRHIHPALAPYMERAAYVGGVDGYSNIGASEGVPDEPSGTMPHALMLSFGKGNQEEAWNAFNEGVADTVPRIALCDTYTDEVDEVLRAAEELGDDLDGVRLDTTGSRRGNFKHIIEEVRHELATQLGRHDVDIYVSGGIDAETAAELNGYVDGFGIGSAITDADPVDFGLDIVERDGEPISKRGKLSGVNNTDWRMKQIIEDGEIVAKEL